jgi:hypothetical protein
MFPNAGRSYPTGIEEVLQMRAWNAVGYRFRLCNIPEGYQYPWKGNAFGSSLAAVLPKFKIKRANFPRIM